jgi:hypothetical protein
MLVFKEEEKQNLLPSENETGVSKLDSIGGSCHFKIHLSFSYSFVMLSSLSDVNRLHMEALH